MPSNFMSLDDFPTFTGEESPKEQIRALHNYLFVMREQLIYMLQNLTTENWNATALQDLTDGTQAEFVKTLQAVSNQLTQMKSTVDGLSARVSGAESLSGRVGSLEQNVGALTDWATEHESSTADLPQRMTDAETVIGLLQKSSEESNANIAELEQRVLDNEIGIGELDEQVNGDAGIAAQLAQLTESVTALQISLDALCQVVQISDTGITIGQEGKDLRLIGTVYINDVAVEQESGNNEVT